MQELLEKEVVGLDDLRRILGPRPFESAELRNINRFRGELDRAAAALKPAGEVVWQWIESFRSPGLQLAGAGGTGAVDEESGDEGPGDGEDDDDDDSGEGGGGGGGGGGGLGGFWQGIGTGRKYPVAT